MSRIARGFGVMPTNRENLEKWFNLVRFDVGPYILVRLCLLEILRITI